MKESKNKKAYYLGLFTFAVFIFIIISFFFNNSGIRHNIEKYNLKEPVLIDLIDINMDDEELISFNKKELENELNNLNVPITSLPQQTEESTKLDNQNQENINNTANVKSSIEASINTKPIIKKGLFLRAASFGVKLNADNLVKKVKKDYPTIESHIEKTTINKKIYYVVFLGPFQNIETIKRIKIEFDFENQLNSSIEER